jgi:hypothetical protein
VERSDFAAALLALRDPPLPGCYRWRTQAGKERGNGLSIAPVRGFCRIEDGLDFSFALERHQEFARVLLA